MHLIFILFAGFLSISAAHDYDIHGEHDIHISVTDIEITSHGEIEISIKVFLDDLMNSVGLELGAELPDNYTSSDDLINQFLDDNFHFSINGKKLECELEDTTHSSPAVWITLISHTDDEIENIEIENKILTELFDDQANLVNVDYDGERYSDMLDGDNTTYKIAVGK